jgi:site-specific DNA-methyltransferase (adenine-specific)
MNSVVKNIDCMIGMAEYPDKWFELAIVDPPYGIDIYNCESKSKNNGFKVHSNNGWDKNIPDENYFKELFRVSKHQIIWGGNYFNLPVSKGWAIWNKVQRNFDFADGELAWTSFNVAIRIFDYARGNDSGFAPKLKNIERIGINIHPTQKPVKLYKWLLDKYAKQGDKILDTHLGSGSSRIACYDYAFDFTGFELDKDYFDAQEKRFKNHTEQIRMFASNRV